LRVVPRPIEDVAGILGEEIRLELEEFDRRFRVDCGDRRFAFAFLDQRMMEALLALPPVPSPEGTGKGAASNGVGPVGKRNGRSVG
jgi:hypothetical protein